MVQRYVKSQTTPGSQDCAFAMGCRIQADPVIDRLRKIHQVSPEIDPETLEISPEIHQIRPEVHQISPATLEINPEHPVIERLMAMCQAAPESQEAEAAGMLVYETAALAGGYGVEDPSGFARRVTRVMASS